MSGEERSRESGRFIVAAALALWVIIVAIVKSSWVN